VITEKGGEHYRKGGCVDWFPLHRKFFCRLISNSLNNSLYYDVNCYTIPWQSYVWAIKITI